MLAPIALLALAVQEQQETSPIPPSPYDRVIELEIKPDDPLLAGHRPSVIIEYEVEFEGTLHLWAESRALDPNLTLRRGADKCLEDDNSHSS